MNESLRALIELQGRDALILAKRRFIDSVPRRIQEVDEPLSLARLELQKLSQKQEALTKKKRDKEQRVEEIGEKIGKMRARAADIKTNKEYQAHQKEIEASEAEIRAVEDDILVVMEEHESMQPEFAARRSRVQEEEAKLSGYRKELDAEVSRLEEELNGLKKERADLAARVAPDHYQLYRKLLVAGNGIAVTPTKDEICMGCNMHIPPQLFVEIRKNEDIHTCPQCHRILYYPEE